MRERGNDWYLAWNNNSYHLPRSQGDGISLIQTVYAPIRAAIALFSGRPAGNLEDLKYRMTAEQIICVCCGGELYGAGEGHNKENCNIYQKAMEVLMDNGGHERKLLLARQEKN